MNSNSEMFSELPDDLFAAQTTENMDSPVR